MSDQTNDELPERAKAIRRLMEAGVGRNGSGHWRQQELAYRVGVSKGTLNRWIIGKYIDPNDLNCLVEVFFSRAEDKVTYSREFQILTASQSSTLDEGIFSPQYSKYDLWNYMLRPIRGNVERLLTESGEFDGTPGFLLEHLSSSKITDQFIVPAPKWFSDWASTPDGSGYAPYELRPPVDLDGSSDFAQLQKYYPDARILDLIRHHSEQYARWVYEQHKDSRVQFPPFNKPTIGLLGWKQVQPAGREERAHLRLINYQSDYYTNQVMTEVMRDIRKERPGAFQNVGKSYPVSDGLYLPYFTPSMALNIQVVTKGSNGPETHITMTSDRIGNKNQTGKFNSTVDEGLGIDDVDPVTGLVTFDSWVLRALSEELGIVPRALFPKDRRDPIDNLIFLEFSVEMVNFEPFLSCVVTLDMTTEELLEAIRANARDASREIEQFKTIPYTAEGFMDLLIDHPTGVAGFTTFSPLIFDLIIQKGLVPKGG